jgi:hypothetical protein
VANQEFRIDSESKEEHEAAISPKQIHDFAIILHVDLKGRPGTRR